MTPRYPIYIISKGRWESRPTTKLLEHFQVSYKIVIEPQEHDNYAGFIDPAHILVLPFSNLGQGSIPARNWVWEHSINEGAKRHWILDDNIRSFVRLGNNKRIRVNSSAVFNVMEDFVDRYKNIALAGPHKSGFADARKKHLPYTLNSRIYSCILIRNDLAFRWRGRYNEDTDLSLRVLKAGWCTILFKAFLMDKSTTMKMRGGNTDELYANDGRLKMAQSLRKQHPDVCTIVRRWGRWQHLVDYSHFKNNKLVRNPDVEVISGVNNYGMRLVEPGAINE